MSDAPPPRPHRGKLRLSGEMLAFVLSLIWLAMLVAAFRVLGLRGAEIAQTLGLVVVGYVLVRILPALG